MKIYFPTTRTIWKFHFHDYASAITYLYRGNMVKSIPFKDEWLATIGAIEVD